MSQVRSSPFVLDAVEEFLRSKEPREAKTFAAYRGVLRGSDRGTKTPLGTALAPYFQNRRVHSLTPDEVSIWFTQRVKGGAQSTKHRVSKAARAFLRFCRQRGYTHLDLDASIDPFKPGGSRVIHLGWNDIHRLIDAIDEPRLKFAVEWLFYTGCRVGEAVSARHQDVRRAPENGALFWEIPDSKTHTPRAVWLPDTLTEHLQQTRAANGPRSHWPILWDSDGRGFGRTENPATPISARTINGALERAAARAGITVKVTAHVARHSYCTNWITEHGESEADMTRLSRQIGTSVGVLRSTYVHLHFTPDQWDDVRSFGRR